MKLVLIGIAGAGKSTQGVILSDHTGLEYLSTGDIFRQVALKKTELGRYVKQTMKKGKLIPDEKTIPIVKKYLGSEKFRRGYILDGFPRTVNQAKKYEDGVDYVIYIFLSDREALWRLSRRRQKIRQDDDLKTILHRIEVFHKETEPVLDYYKKKGKLIFIDGEQTVQQVSKQILYSLNLFFQNGKTFKQKRKKKLIIGLTGLPGSGKTEAAEFFASKKIPVISFGDYINLHIDKEKIPHTPENHKKIMQDVRRKYGMAALARLSKEKIKKILQDNCCIVIDGIRSWEEYVYLQKEFSSTDIFIITLCTDRQLRYKRIKNRRERNALYGRSRDENEIKVTGLGNTIALGDYFVDNNNSISNLHCKLGKIFAEIYFTE